MHTIGIIGAGLIGKKRAASFASFKNVRLAAVCDLSPGRAQGLAKEFGSAVEKDATSLINRSDIDAVVIATANDAIVPCAVQALRAEKHVLAEKPAGRNPEELRELVEAAKNARGILRVGFNHRFHPGLQKAQELVRAGAVGPLMYIRARYGHGGRIGYDKEWRADPALSGGGELLDQGVHLIDLSRWIAGDLGLEFGRVETYFWNMPVEDNGFLLLKSPHSNVRAFLHASCTEWKNLFDFEIFGQTGKIQIFGLGRSYGAEELRFYKMKPEMGPPDFERHEFPGEDDSWKFEFAAFLQEIEGKKTDIATGEDAYHAVRLVYEAYRQSDRRRV